MRATAGKTMVGLILAVVAAVPVLAVEPPLASAGLEEEVRELNTTLGQLVGLLRRQLESSNAALLMQRVQLMTSRIAPLEEELRSTRGEEQGLQSSLDEMVLSAAAFEAQLEREADEDKITAEHARNLREQQQPVLDQRKKQAEDRLWAVQQRVIDLEQRLAARRTEIETWEAEIDRALGLR